MCIVYTDAMSASKGFFLDRSLKRAIVVLTGIIVVGAGGLYLAVEVAESLSVLRNWDDMRSRVHPPREIFEGRRRRGQSGRHVPVRPERRWVAERYSYSSSEEYLSLPLGSGSRASTGSGASYDLEPNLGRSDPEPSEVDRGRRWALSESRVSLAPEYTSPSSPTNVSIPKVGSEPGGQRTWKATANDLSRSLLALESALSDLHREERGQSPPEKRRPSQISRSSAGPTPPGDPEPVPLDGVGWLAAAGAAYAVRRLRMSNADGVTTDE